MKEKSSWVVQTVAKEFGYKLDVAAVHVVIQENPQIIEVFISEIQQTIDVYNEHKDGNFFLGIGRQLLINAAYLASIYNEVLPSYETVLAYLQSDEELYDEVMHELKTSPYFDQVYALQEPGYLLHNLLILFYRTALLCMIPVLREKNAQLSSTIEEMACALEMNGVRTHLFLSIKHWIESWEEEGFAQDLAEKIL
jgi:hypothetical protein